MLETLFFIIMYLYFSFSFANVDRSLARLPQNAPLYVRRAGERKVTEAVAHHHSLVQLDDLQNKLKAMKRLRHIHMSRDPFPDCSNH